MWKPNIAKEFEELIGLIEYLGKKWVLLILITIYFSEKVSFGLLKKLTKPITSKILSQKLKFLEQSGLILKKIIIERSKRVEYYITETGKKVINVFLNIQNLSKTNEASKTHLD